MPVLGFYRFGELPGVGFLDFVQVVSVCRFEGIDQHLGVVVPVPDVIEAFHFFISHA
jgi:hypothetical protein